MAIGSASLTLATSWGGTTYPWISGQILGLFTLGIVALAIFVPVERRAKEPILPMRLFSSSVFSVCSVLAFIVGFAMLGAITFLPTFLQYVDGVSASISGVRMLPLVLGLLLTSISAGTIVGRTGRYKVFPVAGTAIMAVGLFLLSRMTEHTSTLLASVYMVVLGAGIGLCMQTLNADRPEHRELQRPGGRDLWRHVLSLARLLFWRRHLRIAVWPTSWPADSSERCTRRRASARLPPAHRRHCMRCRPRASPPSSMPTHSRWTRCS